MKRAINRKTPNAHNQVGLASIMVTMVMMIVLTLIVIGFATISRREQTDTLNSQLGTQAFYAAETGVNDAWQDINTALAAGLPINKTNCGNVGSGVYDNLTGTINNNQNVKYTCLLVSSELPNILLTGVSTSQAVSMDGVNASGAATPISSLSFTWQSSGGGNDTTCTGSSTFVPTTSWTCDFGVLEVEVVPTDAADLTQTALLDNEFTSYFVPVHTQPGGPGAGTVNYTDCTPGPGAPGATCGQIVQAINCATGTCKVTVNLPGATDDYAVRVQSLYEPSNITITPQNGELISGGQVAVDSTGEANDVLRRIQVRFSLGSSSAPDSGIETYDSLCKRFSVSPGPPPVFTEGSPTCPAP